MGKYDLWRDVPNDLWILKDKQGNILKKADSIEKIKNFVKMKERLKENECRLAHIEWVKQGGF